MQNEKKTLIPAIKLILKCSIKFYKSITSDYFV